MSSLNTNDYKNNQDFEGHGIWQFEEFLNQNLNQFGIKEVGRVQQKEVKTSFSGEEEETVEFDLILMSDGTSVKGTCTTTPPKGKGGGSGKKGAEFGLDLSNIKNEKQALEAFDKFHAITTAFQLKNHPANTPLNIFTKGDSRWKELGDNRKINAILNLADKFRERGIEVFVNDKPIVTNNPQNDYKAIDYQFG